MIRQLNIYIISPTQAPCINRPVIETVKYSKIHNKACPKQRNYNVWPFRILTHILLSSSPLLLFCGLQKVLQKLVIQVLELDHISHLWTTWWWSRRERSKPRWVRRRPHHLGVVLAGEVQSCHVSPQVERRSVISPSSFLSSVKCAQPNSSPTLCGITNLGCKLAPGPSSDAPVANIFLWFLLGFSLVLSSVSSFHE